MQRDRSLLKTWFEKGDKPTQSQFADLIDSMFNLQEDSYLLSSILDYNSTKTYKLNDLVIYSGTLWTCKINGSTGTFQFDNWNKLPNYVHRYAGVAPGWATSISYLLNDLITINGLIYICTSAHTSSSLNMPANSTYWSRLETTDGKLVNWTAALYLQGDLVYFGRNIYQCAVSSLVSTNFSNELTASSWKPVSLLEQWQPTTSYYIGDFIFNGNNLYQSLVSHISSGSFSSDLANWQSFGNTGSTIYTQKFTVSSSLGPWVFTLTAPYPNSVLGFILNGRFMDIPGDVTQTGSNGEIFTWVSSDGGLETGDKIQIKYI